jgi:hypothetical protein
MRECPVCAGDGWILDDEVHTRGCPRCTLPGQDHGSGFIYPDERPVPVGESPRDRRRQMHLVE